jgi:hypothetical protein
MKIKIIAGKFIFNTIDDDGVICARDAGKEGETGCRPAAVAQQSHDRKLGKDF